MTMSKDLVQKIAARALWTFCESMLAFITVGSQIEAIDWKAALRISATAVLASVLKSIMLGLPEAGGESNDDEE